MQNEDKSSEKKQKEELGLNYLYVTITVLYFADYELNSVFKKRNDREVFPFFSYYFSQRSKLEIFEMIS